MGLGASALVATAPSATAAISIDTSTWYVIVNVNSGKALDLYNWSTADGAEFRQWTRTDATNQQFQFVSSGSGYYRLKNRYSGKAVDVWNWSTADGGEINQYTDLNGANQQWSLTGSNNDSVRFINRNSGKAMEVYNWSTSDGGDIAQWTDYGNANQQWKLVAVGSGASSGGSTTTTSGSSGGGSSSTGLVGWATQNGGTTGGSSSTVVNVSSLSAFSSAINSSTSQTVRLTGPISCSGMLQVASNKTIIGAGSGQTISGCGLNLSGDRNIIIRNLKFQNWDDDAINIQESSMNVWIDHCDFTNGYDGTVDIKRGSDFITVSWSHVYNHDKTMLLGHSDDNGSQDTGHLRVTYHHNWFDATTQRHPRVRFGNPVHVFNNYYYRNSGYGVASTMGAGVLVEGNYFEGVSDPYHLGEAASGPGTLVARNNYLTGSGSGQSGGSVASIPYSYTVDTASNVKSIVTGGAGVGHLNL